MNVIFHIKTKHMDHDFFLTRESSFISSLTQATDLA